MRVRVAESAYNAADAGTRSGSLPVLIALPHVAGYDVSGIVDALGDGVDSLSVGDAVIGCLPWNVMAVLRSTSSSRLRCSSPRRQAFHSPTPRHSLQSPSPHGRLFSIWVTPPPGRVFDRRRGRHGP